MRKKKTLTIVFPFLFIVVVGVLAAAAFYTSPQGKCGDAIQQPKFSGQIEGTGISWRIAVPEPELLCIHISNDEDGVKEFLFVTVSTPTDRGFTFPLSRNPRLDKGQEILYAHTWDDQTEPLHRVSIQGAIMGQGGVSCTRQDILGPVTISSCLPIL